jgi:hypothetical protein
MVNLFVDIASPHLHMSINFVDGLSVTSAAFNVLYFLFEMLRNAVCGQSEYAQSDAYLVVSIDNCGSQNKKGNTFRAALNFLISKLLTTG